jgi:hypothetical protein
VTSDRHLSPQPRSASARGPAPAYSLRALGKRNLPESLEVAQGTWRLTRTVKHDFWAATGFYENGAGERAVLKIGRTEPFAGFPLEWTGRFLCAREMRFYGALADLPNVPAVIGKVGRTGFLHAFVPGEPLSRERPVADGFFVNLQALMQEIHRRGIAYVDANKPENILVGADGLPHLIDFQISWDLHELGNHFVNRWWLGRLQQSDRYHVLKHKKRMRPDQTTTEELATVQKRSGLIRLHRFLTRPYFMIRRRLFQRLKESGRLLPEGSK